MGKPTESGDDLPEKGTRPTREADREGQQKPDEETWEWDGRGWKKVA